MHLGEEEEADGGTVRVMGRCAGEGGWKQVGRTGVKKVRSRAF